MMKEKFIRVLMIEPLKHPKEVYIVNDLQFMNHLVSIGNYCPCHAELKIIENNVGLLKNEEGELLNLKGNRKINGEIIAGTFFIVGFDKFGFISSLNEESCKKYCDLLWNAETYTDKEVRQSYWGNFENVIDSMEYET